MSKRITGLLVVFLCISLVLLGSGCAPGARDASQPIGPAQFIISTVQFLLVGVFIWWLMVLKPSQNKEQAHESFIEGLKKNDEVLTSSGIFGRVVTVKPEYIALEIAPNVKVKVEPKHVLTPPGEKKQPVQKEKK